VLDIPTADYEDTSNWVRIELRWDGHPTLSYLWEGGPASAWATGAPNPDPIWEVRLPRSDVTKDGDTASVLITRSKAMTLGVAIETETA
jgi:hypothetical protein